MRVKNAVYGFILVIAAASTGCGDLASGINKIASGQICALTKTEVMALNQAAIQVGASQTPPIVIPVLTDAQAQAVANFFALNAICTTQDIANLPARIEAGEQLQGLEELAAAFAGSGIDPSNLDPNALTSLLNQILGV